MEKSVRHVCSHIFALILAAASAESSWTFSFGPEVSPFLSQSLQSHLSLLTTDTPVHVSCGRTNATRSLISDEEVAALPADAFIVRGGLEAFGDSDSILVAVVGAGGRAVSYGAYDFLQRGLGFGFLHPMKVVRPAHANAAAILALDSRSVPLLEVRGSHVHGEHPNELSGMLNGFDAEGGHDSKQEWLDLLPEWSMYLQWLIAHKQTNVEWSLLSAKAYKIFDESDERQDRLRTLVNMAKDHGFVVGIDCPFTQMQEHGWRLWPVTHKNAEDDWALIQSRLDWVLGAGFDYVISELGTTEQTEGGDVERLMDMLNRTYRHVHTMERTSPDAITGTVLPRDFMVENHISSGQTVPGYPDPLHPDQNINFNWLTYYLEPGIINRPHTVQIYSLEDPVFSYGQDNFSATVDFIDLMLDNDRGVIWYPETAYWCNYDNSVPLFLPIYALSRVSDLQLLLRQSRGHADRKPMMGQMLFESGWQWGYWLANVVAMESQWSLDVDASAESELRRLLVDILAPLSQAQADVEVLSDSLVDLTIEQHRLLIRGEVKGLPAPGEDLYERSGIAYMIGHDGIADLFQLVGRLGIAQVSSQPDRLQYSDLFGHGTPFNKDAVAMYTSAIQPLLQDMESTFKEKHVAIQDAVRRLVLPGQDIASTDPRTEILQDFNASALVFSLRATQQLALYDAAAQGWNGLFGPGKYAKQRMADARVALSSAASVMQNQEARYGLFAKGSSRLWVWGLHINPSGYQYGSLWAAHSLYYWRRDQEIVEQQIVSPCFKNIINPVDQLAGSGEAPAVHDILDVLQSVLHLVPGLHDLSDCMVAAKKEPYADAFNFPMPMIV